MIFDIHFFTYIFICIDISKKLSVVFLFYESILNSLDKSTLIGKGMDNTSILITAHYYIENEDVYQ